MKVPKDWAAFVVIAVSAALQLVLAFQPLGFLLTNLLPDDAFYYFQIARNIVAGYGSTFDGTHFTNGYHPLWLAILLPVYATLFHGNVDTLTPIYAALSISVLMNVGTMIVLYRLIRRITGSQSIRAFALTLWCLNPFVLYESLNGLETSLALFMLSLFVLFAVRFEEKNKTIDAAMLGVAAGLVVLARLDMICYVLAYAAYVLVRYPIVEGIRRNLAAAIPAMLIVGSWLLLNYLTSGMLLTSSSGANVLVNHVLVVQDNGTGFLVLARATLFMLVYNAPLVLTQTGAIWLVWLLPGMAVALISSKHLSLPKVRSLEALPFFLFGGFVLLFILNAGVRFTARSWYFISFNLFLVACAAWILPQLPLKKYMKQVVLCVLSVGVFCSFTLSWKETLYNRMPNQVSMYQMGQWMRGHLAPGTSVGIFNAGIIGYFSGMHIVNLDGLVNNSVYEAMQDRSLWAYIQHEQLVYIADFPIYLTYRYRSFFGIPDIMTKLNSVHEISVPGSEKDKTLTIYKVDRSEQNLVLYR